MSITVNLYYTGKDGSARAFAEEMVARGVVERVRAEEGNERYYAVSISGMNGALVQNEYVQ